MKQTRLTDEEVRQVSEQLKNQIADRVAWKIAWPISWGIIKCFCVFYTAVGVILIIFRHLF